jgi:hypothetical protein
MKLTKLYWNCKCTKNYIHSKKELKCLVCNALQEDQPNSPINEVIVLLKKEHKSLNRQIESTSFGKYTLIRLIEIEKELKILSNKKGD